MHAVIQWRKPDSNRILYVPKKSWGNVYSKKGGFFLPESIELPSARFLRLVLYVLSLNPPPWAASLIRHLLIFSFSSFVSSPQNRYSVSFSRRTNNLPVIFDICSPLVDSMRLLVVYLCRTLLLPDFLLISTHMPEIFLPKSSMI